MTASSPTPSLPWRENPGHRRWLRAEADALFAFFEPDSIDPSGGFHSLDNSRAPVGRGDGAAAACDDEARALFRDRASAWGGPARRISSTTGCARCSTRHRDARWGGYFWSFDPDGPRESEKLAYGHAFVLLAASSAKCAGHPDADRLLADISEVLETRFWEPGPGASAEEFREDWTPFSAYRGQNSNMHLTEALMAAFEATGERSYLDKAERIADLILRRNAGAADWRVPEHYHADWSARSRL